MKLTKEEYEAEFDGFGILCQELSQRHGSSKLPPTTTHFALAKRLGRYLLHAVGKGCQVVCRFSVMLIMLATWFKGPVHLGGVLCMVSFDCKGFQLSECFGTFLRGE
eukprot:3290779-Amphidinium_carterae.1